MNTATYTATLESATAYVAAMKAAFDAADEAFENLYWGAATPERAAAEAARDLAADALAVARDSLNALQPESYDEDYQEGPCCSICDGLGHGYPGGGPCPLEDRGYWDARQEEERYI